MRVLLINPPRENELLGNNPAIIDEERGHNPPLGLLYVAAYLEQFSAHRVEVLDAQAEELSYEALKEEIVLRRPDVVGLTAMTFTLLDVIETARLVKEINPATPVVLGGPHVHLYPQETLDIPEVDYLVLGEGEVAFAEMLDRIGDPAGLAQVEGIAFNNNGERVITSIRALEYDLDALPFPARHLTPYKKYSSVIAKRAPITTIFTSRGCPHKCIFCDRPHLGKQFRARSAKNVVDEMEECVNIGIREFLVYDDTFTIQRQRVLDVCDEIVRRKLDIGWDIRARVNTVDGEMLRKLRRANCERIHYGVEAGTDRVLKILQKGITLEQARWAFHITKKAGISTLAYFMVGSPTETREDIMETIGLAKSLGPDFVHITIVTPFPGTQLYAMGMDQGQFTHDFWREFAAHPTSDFQPQYWEENLSRQELQELVTYAYQSFYERPGYIVQRLLQVRSPGELMRKARAGMKVFLMKPGE
jgi:anaerobic magnesium-protoporphyrin IX monomethyl ester cyclase